MATGSSTQDDTTPHGKTKVISKHTAVDYGPLSAYPGDHYNNFRGGSYKMTTPTDNDPFVLYRRYGGVAEEAGCYWTVEQRGGNLSFALDSSILPQWGCALNKEVRLVIPPGILLFEGFAAPQGSYPGGGWQVFIPLTVVKPLLDAQKAATDGKSREAVQSYIKTAFSAQKSLLEKYEKKLKEQSLKYLNDFCTMENAQRLIKSGNMIRSLPGPVQNVLSSQTTSVTSTSNSETMPGGSYLVHRETIQLPNGMSASVSLHVRIEFSHETTRTYRSGNTIITEITRHYNRIYEWK